MKLYTTLLLALLAGGLIYLIRRRLKLALVTGGVAYLVLLPARLLFAAGSLNDRLDDLVVPALVVFGVWLVLWQASVAYERRKRARRAAGEPPDRRAAAPVLRQASGERGSVGGRRRGSGGRT